jgi:hypothetical protein
MIQANQCFHVALGVLKDLMEQWTMVKPNGDQLTPVLDESTQELNELKGTFDEKAHAA